MIIDSRNADYSDEASSASLFSPRSVINIFSLYAGPGQRSGGVSARYRAVIDVLNFIEWYRDYVPRWCAFHLRSMRDCHFLSGRICTREKKNERTQRINNRTTMISVSGEWILECKYMYSAAVTFSRVTATKDHGNRFTRELTRPCRAIMIFNSWHGRLIISISARPSRFVR